MENKLKRTQSAWWASQDLGYSLGYRGWCTSHLHTSHKHWWTPD